MKITRIIALAVIVASGGVAVGHAQNLRNADEPAEFPPSSYQGTQYVDSRGCVYVRAGISGNVTWVPRVTRSRRQICNQQPTFAEGVPASPPQAPVAAPVQITLDEPKVETPVKAKPVPKKVAKAVAPVAKPKPRKPVVVAAVAKPKPVRTKVVKQKRVTAPVEAVAPKPLAKPNAKATPKSVAVAKAPKTTVKRARRVSGANKVKVVTKDGVTPTINAATRILPKHVFENRQNTQNLSIPKGYRRVWNDGRLNPKRAEQSLAGQAQVRMIWTQTVPRRLIDTKNGRDITATTPLVYPFVDKSTQSRELGNVTIVQKDGKVLKRIVRNSKAAKARQPVVSSRSKPVAKTSQTTATNAVQFVQVATFGQKNNAQATAQRIKRMGLPVRIGKYTRSGKTYRMVLAGPFKKDATRVLAKLRGAGFADAILR